MQKYAINRQIWRCKAESLNIIITLTNVKTDVLSTVNTLTCTTTKQHNCVDNVR